MRRGSFAVNPHESALDRDGREPDPVKERRRRVPLRLCRWPLLAHDAFIPRGNRPVAAGRNRVLDESAVARHFEDPIGVCATGAPSMALIAQARHGIAVRPSLASIAERLIGCARSQFRSFADLEIRRSTSCPAGLRIDFERSIETMQSVLNASAPACFAT